MESVIEPRIGSTAGPNEESATAAAPQVSLFRLYLLRGGYLFLGGGLAAWKWPLFIHHHAAWAPMEGVVNCMLAALSILALLGLRYPIQMLPILLFESAWKTIWLTTVALPLWRSHQLDPATRELTGQCLLVIVILAAIPWHHVIRQYTTKHPDRWR
jgi:hypothetical protein